MVNRLLTLLLIGYLVACDEVETTIHDFGVINNSSNQELLITYQTINQEIPSSIPVDSMRNPDYEIPSWIVSGDQNKLSNDDLSVYFTEFTIFNVTDTFVISSDSKNWDYSFGGEDSGHKVHYYFFEITNEDL